MAEVPISYVHNIYWTPLFKWSHRNAGFYCFKKDYSGGKFAKTIAIAGLWSEFTATNRAPLSHHQKTPRIFISVGRQLFIIINYYYRWQRETRSKVFESRKQRESALSTDASYFHTVLGTPRIRGLELIRFFTRDQVVNEYVLAAKSRKTLSYRVIVSPWTAD